MIETRRLATRPFVPGDAETLLALWGDPANERFAGELMPCSTADVLAWLERWPAWGVWEREGDELVGDCSLHFDAGFGEWELSYGFRRDRWGRGYATEAAQACVRRGFEALGLAKIVADVDPTNAASARVLEKCGFRHACELADGRLFYVVTSPR